MTALPDSIALTQYDSYLLAARNPALRSAAADAMDAFERLATEALRVAGARDPAEGARAFVALSDGFALRRLAVDHEDSTHTGELRDAMRSLFIAYAMNDAERAAWSERLTRPANGGDEPGV
jgi:hypothetical protein